MKRILVLLISILLSLPLALGGIAGVAYYTTSEENIPKPSIMAMDVPVAPAAYHWREPVFGGLIHRDFEKELPAQGTHLGQLGAATLPLSVPAGYNSRATVYSGQEKMWSGQAAELANYAFLDNGRYSMLVECERPGTDMKGSGTISYLVSFVVQVEPRFESSEEWVAQGDVMAIRVFNLQSQQPKAESTLGNIQFVPSGNGIMTAYVPIGHGCPLGTYSIQLSIGHYIFDIPVRVTESHFGLEAVVVPEEVPGVETPPEQKPDINPALTKDFFKTIAPLLEESDPVQYWDGVFVPPAKGILAQDYGMLRYTNQEPEPTSWAGIDILAEKNSPVIAPNRGRVVFAGKLEATGNTLVIDHGGGLKSLFYHMAELMVKEGDMVEKSDEIGRVGSTGMVTKTKLHYEARLWHATVNPHLLFNGLSKLYHFDR